MPGDTVLGEAHATVSSIPAWRGWWLRADTALRLGPRPVALFAWHRLRLSLGIAHRALPALPAPAGPFLPGAKPIAVQAQDWHGPFNPSTHALDILAQPITDIRSLWDAHRLAPLLHLALAAKRDPAGDHSGLHHGVP